MNEKLQLTPVSGGRPIDLTVNSREDLRRGGDTTKHRVVGTISQARRAFVERSYSRDIVTNWSNFKKAGFPVVPEMYVGSDGQLYAEDLRTAGSEIYGKSLLGVISDKNNNRETHPADSLFLSLMQSEQHGAIADAVRKYIVMANEYGFTLPRDDAFDLIVHPNRAENPWELIIFDVAQAGTFDPFDIEAPHTVDDARGDNYRRGNAFLENLTILESRLRVS